MSGHRRQSRAERQVRSHQPPTPLPDPHMSRRGAHLRVSLEVSLVKRLVVGRDASGQGRGFVGQCQGGLGPILHAPPPRPLPACLGPGHRGRCCGWWARARAASTPLMGEPGCDWRGGRGAPVGYPSCGQRGTRTGWSFEAGQSPQSS